MRPPGLIPLTAGEVRIFETKPTVREAIEDLYYGPSPIYVMGRTDPISFVRGKRGIAGSINVGANPYAHTAARRRLKRTPAWAFTYHKGLLITDFYYLDPKTFGSENKDLAEVAPYFAALNDIVNPLAGFND